MVLNSPHAPHPGWQWVTPDLLAALITSQLSVIIAVDPATVLPDDVPVVSDQMVAAGVTTDDVTAFWTWLGVPL